MNYFWCFISENMKLNSAKSRNLELFQKNCTKLKLGCSSKIDDA